MGEKKEKEKERVQIHAERGDEKVKRGKEEG